jgi:hypothetical protein
MIPVILAWLVVLVALPLNWYVTIKLARLSRAHPDARVLRERTYVALALSLIVTIFAFVFLNNGMEFPVLNNQATQLVTRTAVLALAFPAAYWLYLYRNGRRG